MKLVHTLPTFFTVASVLMILLSFYSIWFVFPLGIYFSLILIVSSLEYKNISIGFLSIITSSIQLYGYGWGFIKAYFKKVVFGKNKSVEDELNKYYNKK
jgi:hypothetical protein